LVATAAPMQCLDVSALVVAEKYMMKFPLASCFTDGAHVLGELASTQAGRFGSASFCEPSAFSTMLQVLKSPDTAIWMWIELPMVRVAKAYQVLPSSNTHGSGVWCQLVRMLKCFHLLPGKLTPPISGPASVRLMSLTSGFGTGEAMVNETSAQRATNKLCNMLTIEICTSWRFEIL